MLKAYLLAAGLSLLATAGGGAMPMAALDSGQQVVKADWICGPGYHIGRGGRHCWPYGRAPIEEIPYGYVVPAPLPAYVLNPPPILECPRGYHLGPGLKHCWPNRYY